MTVQKQNRIARRTILDGARYPKDESKMASRQLVALNKTNGYGDGFFLYDGSLYYGYGEGNGASFEAKQAG